VSPGLSSSTHLRIGAVDLHCQDATEQRPGLGVGGLLLYDILEKSDGRISLAQPVKRPRKIELQFYIFRSHLVGGGQRGQGFLVAP